MHVTSVDKKIDIRLPISAYICRAKYKNYYITVTRFENQRLENHVEIPDKDRMRINREVFRCSIYRLLIGQYLSIEICR